jgi:predicted SAM-dependent methyltransferase
VHLGPGQKKYLDGWVNVDANFVSSRPDIWADLRFPLPFSDNTASALYSHHVIEHLPNLNAHFAEMYRCLQPGGVLRTGGPHGDNAIRAFLAGDSNWFGDWPTYRRSIGGRFENFIFCKGEHLTILTESFLCELAEDAGFVDIKVEKPRETGHSELFDAAVMAMEEAPTGRPVKTVLIEAMKPTL